MKDHRHEIDQIQIINLFSDICWTYAQFQWYHWSRIKLFGGFPALFWFNNVWPT